MNQSIATVYKKYFYGLSWYVINNNGTRQDAEDVFQEVVLNFISMVQKNQFREESGIKTFLYAINRHIWLNELKKKGKRLLREKKYSGQQDTMEIDVSNLIEKNQAREQVAELLGQLGETCRKILLLYYYEGLSIKEILPYFDYENEQVIRNKKCKCLDQLNHVINKQPSLRRKLKTLLQEDKELYSF